MSLDAAELPIPSHTSASESYLSLMESEGSGGGSPADLALSDTFRALERLQNLPDDWDGFGSLSANERTIGLAKNLLAGLRSQIVRNGGRWLRPLLSLSENGEVVVEWWKPTRKLTLYVSDQGSHFVQVWGVDMETEMEDGPLSDYKFPILWAWLMA